MEGLLPHEVGWLPGATSRAGHDPRTKCRLAAEFFLAQRLLQPRGMLVEGACAEGHELVCVIQGARVTGVLVRGTLRAACPTCGGKPYLTVESGQHPTSTKIPSQPPHALEKPPGRRGQG